MPKIIDDEQVFRAVVQVISAHGYEGATTRRMAEVAGISEVSLFRKYGSKAELVRRAIGVIADQIDFEGAVRYTGDVKADLLRIVDRYQNLAAHYRSFLSVFIPEMQRHPELAEALERPMAIMRAIGGLLARYQEQGVLQPEQPLQSVAALLGPLIFFAMARGTVFEDQIPTIDLEQHVTRFLEGRLSKPRAA